MGIFLFSNAGNRFRSSPLGVVLGYGIVSVLWILLSDRAVVWLFRDFADQAVANTFKGWFFVVVTSGFLYGFLRHGAYRPAVQDVPRKIRLQSLLPFTLLIAGIVALTTVGIIKTLKEAREREVARLQAVSALKVRQLQDWLRERQGDAEFLQRSLFFGDQYRRSVAAAGAEAAEILRLRLDEVRRAWEYQAVTLLDPAGRWIWSTGEAPREFAEPLRLAVERAVRGRDLQRVGPYLGAAGHRRLDYVVPLRVPADSAPIIVLHIDPEQWLYPTLRNWPAPSSTGETGLLRREGDQVVFLSEPRLMKHGALKLSLPLASPSLLSARAIRGDAPEDKVMEATDYRGEPVLGLTHRVPGTDWWLATKIDRAELFAESAGQIIGLGFAGLLTLFAAGVGVVMLRQRQQLAVAGAVAEAQTERLRALNLLDAVAEASDDAIFAKDLEGRYMLFNGAAGRIVGKPVSEVLGKDDHVIFPAGEANPLMDAGWRAPTQARAITMEESLSTAKGRRVFLATKGPLRDAKGQIIGTFGISRDITELKHAERTLSDSEARYRTLFTHSPDAIMVNLADCIILVNDACMRLFGAASAEDLIGKSPFDLFHRDFHPVIRDRLRRLRNGETSMPPLEEKIVRLDGTLAPVEVLAATFPFGDTTAIHVILRDVAQRKEAEESMLRYTEELRTRNEELERFNRLTVGRELDMIELKRQVNELSRQLGRKAPYPLEFMPADQPKPVAREEQP